MDKRKIISSEEAEDRGTKLKFRLTRLLLVFVVVYLLFSLFPGLQINPINIGLDHSWRYAVNWLPQSDYIFGRDIVFTFGPLGYLLFPLDIGQNVIQATIFWCAVYVIFALSLVVLLFKTKKLLPVFLFIVAFILSWSFMAASFMRLTLANEYILLFTIGLLLCTSKLVNGKFIYFLTFFAGLLAGLSLFMKLNIGLSALSMVVIYSLLVLLKDRRKGWKTVISGWAAYLVSVILLIVLHFHSVGNLLHWIRASFEIISGYSAAMNYGTVQFPLLVSGILGFCVFVCLVLLSLKQKLGILFSSLLFIIPVYFAFKESFVRQDGGHIIYYFLFLPFAVSICFLFIKGKKELIITSGVFLVSLLLILTFPIAIRPSHAVSTDFSRAGSFIGLKTGRTNIDSLIHWQEKRNLIATQSRQLLEKDRLPAEWISKIGNSSVDVVPWEICYVPSNGLNWSPNPVLQTYSEYTAYLDNWSAKHYEANDSPQYLIAEYMYIDGRHPLFEATATWRSIISNYNLLEYDQQVKRLLLERKPVANNNELKIINNTKAKVRQWIEIPSSNDLLYAKIHLHPNFAGKTVGTIYLVPPVYIDLLYNTGKGTTFRIIPDNLSNGVLLNYLPSNSEELSELFSGKATDNGRWFRISGPGTGYYSADISISWYETSYAVKYKNTIPQLLHLEKSDTLFRLEHVNSLLPLRNTTTFVVDARKDQLVNILGWAVDKKANTVAGGVFINIDGLIDIPAYYGTDRPDIAAKYKNNDYRFSGFMASFATSILDIGRHTLKLKIVTADKISYYEPLQGSILEIK